MNQHYHNGSNDYFSYIGEPIPVKFPEPELPPPLPSKNGSVSSTRSFEQKLKAERKRYHSDNADSHHSTAKELNNLTEERERRDLLQVLQEHLQWERDAGDRRESRQEYILNQLLDDAERTERAMEARDAATQAHREVERHQLDLHYKNAELERTKELLHQQEEEKIIAQRTAANMAARMRRLELDLVRTQALEAGRRAGVRDGYNIIMRALPDGDRKTKALVDLPSMAYIEEVHDDVYDDNDGASMRSTGTELIKDTRPRYRSGPEWDYRRHEPPRTSHRSKHSSSDNHRSHRQSKTTTQSRPSRTQTTRSIPSQPASRPPSQPPSVERAPHPPRMTPFRKLSDIPEGSHSNGTPRSQDFPRSPALNGTVPNQAARSVASPLHQSTVATPPASIARQTLDHTFPSQSYHFPPPQSRPHSVPATSLPQVVPQSRSSSPEPRMIPPPTFNGTPRVTESTPLTGPVLHTRSETPRLNGYHTTPRAGPSSVHETPKASLTRTVSPPQAPKAVSPAQAFPVMVPPIPIPDFKVHDKPPVTESIPYRDFKPPVIQVEGTRIPDSEPDTGTMTPLSVDYLSSFPRSEREVSRLNAIPEGGSILSGSVAPSPLPEIREPNAIVEEWRRSTSTEDASPRYQAPYMSQIHDPNMLQPPTPHSASSSQGNSLQRRSSNGSHSNSTHSIEFNIEPPSRPPSTSIDPSTSQASGFLSPNHTPQALPLERPEQGPVIPPDSDTETESEVDYSQNTQLPFGFVPISKPPSEPANQTPKMISSNNWGQHGDWGNVASSGSAAGPNTWATPVANAPSFGSHGKPTNGYPPFQGPGPSTSSGSRTPRTAYAAQTTPPGFSYPLPPGRTPSNPAKYPLPSSTNATSRPSSSSSSSSSGSSTTSRSETPMSSRRSSGTPVPGLSPRMRSLQGGVLASNSIRPGESPPDPTTYLNTLANSATGTPRFGKNPHLAGGTPRTNTHSPYTGMQSLYAS
ncbi:hypothetical protein BDZ89DRAFT_1155504 [Hymenopellis radicata]|nr:hypothetical protein BDZ89DRAFT_1155504 [Hymenopellis radicata]